MKVYIPQICREGQNNYLTVDSHVAFTGFTELGCEIAYFNAGWDIQNLKKENVVAGFMEDIKKALIQLNLPVPTPIDYPEELREYLGRQIWQSSLYEILENPSKWNIFIKPAKEVKEFVGFVLKSESDIKNRRLPKKDTLIWCSTIVEFISEWRCFVSYGQILDVRKYKGYWNAFPNEEIIFQAVKKFTKSPVSYTMDFGLTPKGETLLIEANDGFAVSGYGLAAKDYARFLTSRWAELVNINDPYLNQS